MEEPPVNKDAMRLLVGNFIRDNPTMKTSVMVQRMSEIGVKPRTFYNILKRVRVWFYNDKEVRTRKKDKETDTKVG